MSENRVSRLHHHLRKKYERTRTDTEEVAHLAFRMGGGRIGKVSRTAVVYPERIEGRVGQGDQGGKYAIEAESEPFDSETL